MRPYLLIVDDFLADYPAMRALADEAQYETLENPFDCHTYPGIYLLNGMPIYDEMQQKLSQIMGTPVELLTFFMRQSMDKAYCPEQAHTDTAMEQQFSFVLYLNRPEHCQGGTSFLRHKESGWEQACRNDEVWDNAAYVHDGKKPDCFETVLLCPMRSNRLIIYPSYLIHRSEPIDGFGSTPEDARLVAVGFFNLVANADS